MGAYTEIVDFTFTANETSRTFSGLSITKDDFVKVVTTIQVNTASNIDYRLLANSSTNTNYHNQILQGAGSSINTSRENVNRLQRGGNNKVGYAYAYLKLSENDRLNIFSNYTFEIDSSVTTSFSYTTSSGATFTSGITSLTLEAETANAIGTGSRIQIYKLAAEKVADITVSSNTTQVDISNLSIDKDSEYLLVSDMGGASNSNDLNITPNDLTTLSGYHTQRIVGAGSTASASRTNDSRILQLPPDGTIAYTHIKLSNIGAFTAQSYSLFAKGSVEPLIVNYFVSSTAENITSITKLNLRSVETNAIKTGSRFTLYKLYE